MKKFPKIERFGDNGILLTWPSKIDTSIHNEVMSWNKRIQENIFNEKIETVCSYSAIAVYVKDNSKLSFILKDLKKFSSENLVNKVSNSKSYLLIPVCYSEEFALDMEMVKIHTELSADNIIALHTQAIYTVYFNGFLPGFPYLQGMQRRLNTPRRQTPRQKVPAGSVAIGSDQTGIYPCESPGGWNIIGRSPLQFFNVKNEPPTILNTGDRLKFYAISSKEFDVIRKKVLSGNYKLREEVGDD